MKYESTILKRLIDTYGVVGNPRYISEIIKEFIVRGKECFPNLFTYQSDWLAHIDEFGLNPTYTVSYTGQSIYAPNTLERPVKSAILKGQTLVNLVPKKIIDYTASNDWDGYYQLVQNSTKPNEQWRTLQDLKPNTKYYVSCYVETFEDVNGRDYYLNNSSHDCLFVDSMKVNGVVHYQWISKTKNSPYAGTATVVCVSEDAVGRTVSSTRSTGWLMCLAMQRALTWWRCSLKTPVRAITIT